MNPVHRTDGLIQIPGDQLLDWKGVAAMCCVPGVKVTRWAVLAWTKRGVRVRGPAAVGKPKGYRIKLPMVQLPRGMAWRKSDVCAFLAALQGGGPPQGSSNPAATLPPMTGSTPASAPPSAPINRPVQLRRPGRDELGTYPELPTPPMRNGRPRAEVMR